jgi:hypothetical protein
MGERTGDKRRRTWLLNPPPEKLAAISGIWFVAPTVVTLCITQKVDYELEEIEK